MALPILPMVFMHNDPDCSRPKVRMVTHSNGGQIFLGFTRAIPGELTGGHVTPRGSSLSMYALPPTLHQTKPALISLIIDIYVSFI